METARLEELIAQLGDSDGRTRQRAREMLVAIGEPALPSLVGLLANPAVRVRWEAAKALTEAPEPAAIPGLVLLLADSSSEIGWLAAIALIKMGNRSVPHVLRAVAESADSKGFRNAAHHVLHDLSERNAVMGDILKPLLDVLGDETSDLGVISYQADVALRTLRALGGA